MWSHDGFLTARVSRQNQQDGKGVAGVLQHTCTNSDKCLEVVKEPWCGHCPLISWMQKCTNAIKTVDQITEKIRKSGTSLRKLHENVKLWIIHSPTEHGISSPLMGYSLYISCILTTHSLSLIDENTNADKLLLQIYPVTKEQSWTQIWAVWHYWPRASPRCAAGGLRLNGWAQLAERDTV